MALKKIIIHILYLTNSNRLPKVSVAGAKGEVNCKLLLVSMAILISQTDHV